MKKRFLTKRRAKTPFLIGGVVVLAMIFFAFRFMSQKQEVLQEEPLSFATWEKFTEMGRLNMLLKGFAIDSMADVFCEGIEKLDVSALPLGHYLGVVNNSDRAGALQARFGTAKATFMSFDPRIDVLPHVDLILCWDYLCSLSLSEIRATLMQFKKSGATFLLMRHFPEVRKNEEKKRGVFQSINWKIPPYHFPEPIIYIMEHGQHGMESLALWNLENVPL